jgi:hypothetical protein
MTSPRANDAITVGPHYKMVLITVIVTFFVSFAAYALLGMLVANPTPLQTRVIDVFGFVLKATLGTILGLLGGKVA